MKGALLLVGERLCVLLSDAELENICLKQDIQSRFVQDSEMKPQISPVVVLTGGNDCGLYLFV